jgi:hypothetical protein
MPQERENSCQKTVRERKGEISIILTIAVPAEQQRKRVNVIDRRWHSTVSAVREHSQSQRRQQRVYPEDESVL